MRFSIITGGILAGMLFVGAAQARDQSLQPALSGAGERRRRDGRDGRD